MRKIKDRPVVFFKYGFRCIDVSQYLKQSTLFEAYHKTGRQDCQFFFELLWAKLTNQITEEDFNNEILKMNLAFEEIGNEDLIVIGGPTKIPEYLKRPKRALLEPFMIIWKAPEKWFWKKKQ